MSLTVGSAYDRSSASDYQIYFMAKATSIAAP